MSRIRAFNPAQASDAQLRVHQAITQGPRVSGPRDFALTNPDGSLAGPFDALTIAGDLGLAVQRVGEAIRFEGELEPTARELAILIVARTWMCPFEWYAHEAVARRIGVDDAILKDLAEGHKPKGLSARLSAVYDIADEVATTKGLSDETFTAVRSQIEDRELIELLILVGYYTLLAGLLNGLDISLPDPAAKTPTFR